MERQAACDPEAIDEHEPRHPLRVAEREAQGRPSSHGDAYDRRTNETESRNHLVQAIDQGLRRVVPAKRRAPPVPGPIRSEDPIGEGEARESRVAGATRADLRVALRANVLGADITRREVVDPRPARLEEALPRLRRRHNREYRHERQSSPAIKRLRRTGSTEA